MLIRLRTRLPPIYSTLACWLLVFPPAATGQSESITVEEITVQENSEQITIATPHLEAVVRKRGYVSGVAGGSLLDKKTGFRDAGFGLDIADWIMEPGSDETYRDQLPDHMVYQFGNPYHGARAKRSIEGPQICTKAGEVATKIVRGDDFVAIQLRYDYRLAAPGKQTGSKWTQWLVFPNDTRYFISSDRIDAVNASDAMFLRIDMPGHIKHNQGDTFSEVYLSYHGRIPSSEFFENFAPDEKFNYRRDRLKRTNQPLPERMIRGYRLRDAESGEPGPWLAGMTLDPAVVYEAWCHQRGYVCMIEEFGGRPVRAGEAFSAAFTVGYFDSLDEMHAVYDRHRGGVGIEAAESGWRLTKAKAAQP